MPFGKRILDRYHSKVGTNVHVGRHFHILSLYVYLFRKRNPLFRSCLHDPASPGFNEAWQHCDVFSLGVFPHNAKISEYLYIR